MNASESHAPTRSAIAADFFNRLHRFKNLLASKWWILLLTTGLALGVTYYKIHNAPPSYSSTGRMIVSPRVGAANANTGEDLNNFFGTQKSLMEAESVSNRAMLMVLATRTNLEATSTLLTVQVSPKTSIFNLRCVGHDSEYTRAFLDGIMDEYSKLKKEMRSRATSVTKSAVRTELEHLNDELRNSKKEIVDYQSSNSVVFLQTTGNSAGEYLAELTRQHANIKSELQLLMMLTLDENVERQQNLIQQRGVNQSLPASARGTDSSQVPLANDAENKAANKSVGPDTTMVGTQTEYLKAKQQIVLLKAERQELGEFLRPKHPKIIALEEEITRKEKLLDIFRDQSKEQLSNLQHSLELQLANLDAEIKLWEHKSLEISKKMAEYQGIREESTRIQNMYDRLMSVDYSLDMDKDLTQESVAILEAASPAIVMIPSLPKWLSLAAAIGMALGLGILIVMDRLDDRPSSLSELQQIVDEEILGQIPKVRSKDKSAPQVLQEEDDRHALVEAYRNLRSSVMFQGAADNHPKTIVITSAIPSDGKSMTSANLAITLARAGGRVLLVDADLRRGVMHNHFKIPKEPGFSEVLGEQCDWKTAIVKTSVENLSVLPRGTTKRHPGELFVTAMKDKFLKEIAGKYEYILFDTAPVMAADDVSNLAPYVDGVVMVVRAGHTSGRVARAALDLLYQRKVNVLGVVFNAVRSNASEYYYYHYKDYYAKNPTT